MKSKKYYCLKKIIISFLVIISLIITYEIISPQQLRDRLLLPDNMVIQGYKAYDDIGIYRYNKFLNVFHRITKPNILTYSFSWSPNGNSIAFIYKDMDVEGYNLATLDAKSNRINNLVKNGIENYQLDEFSSVTWSPDGKRLLFSVVSENYCSRIVIFDTLNEHLQLLAPSFCPPKNGNQITSLDLSWFPGIYPIIGVKYNYDYSQDGEIYLLNESLSNATFFNKGAYPIWKPDGLSFSYFCWENDSNISSLCLFSKIDGKTKILLNEFYHYHYSWLPMDNAIIYIEAPGESDPRYLTKNELGSGKIIHFRKLWAGTYCYICPDWIDGQIIFPPVKK